MTHCFKRATLLSFFLLLAVWPRLHAQSSMTDEQIMEFVITENAKGTSQQQIVTRLMQRGVDIQQIRRIREKYEKEQKGDILGAKDVTGKSTSEKRLRKNNGDERDDKLKNSENYRRRVIQEKEDEPIMSERRRRLLQQRKEDDYVEGLDFVLMDSLKRFDEIMAEGEEEDGIKVFGRNIFNQKLLTFEPNMNIATPSDYRLGPGDAVFVDIWGASQKTITSTVSPEGAIDIEGFGPVQVSGMTVDEANAHLKSTLGKRFVNSEVRLTVGQTRTITVNVMGEVEAPGTYTLSAFATVFHALYMAGGTNDIGTLRDIKVYRDNRLISTVDIYDFILNGRLKGNVRLASNDVIIVGPYDCLVNIAGKVKRPMFYEMKKTESVSDLLEYAGNFTGDAYKKAVRVVRKTGREREVFNVDEKDFAAFKMDDGDVVTVDAVLDRFSNRIEIRGAVYRPGLYQLDGEVNTVKSLIRKAEGLLGDAFLNRAILDREHEDLTHEMLQVDVKGILNGTAVDIPLQKNDVLYIPSIHDLREEQTVAIHGEVANPGTFLYSEDMTVEDLVIQAGGLLEAAATVQVEVARRVKSPRSEAFAESVGESFSFDLKDGLLVGDESDDFHLMPFDEVYIRRSPAYYQQRNVTISGEVLFSGSYALSKKNERLSDLVAKAGGVTPAAYVKGARLVRVMTDDERRRRENTSRMINLSDSVTVRQLDLSDRYTVGIDLEKALANPGSEYDMVLRENDILYVPEYVSTVKINGAVMYPNTVLYKEGESLSYYINQAGGYGNGARKRRAYVVYLNGTVSRLKSGRSKAIEPGCEIIVPAKDPKKRMSPTEIIGLGTSTASLATMIATLVNLFK